MNSSATTSPELRLFGVRADSGRREVGEEREQPSARFTTVPSRALVIISTIVLTLLLLLVASAGAGTDVPAPSQTYRVQPGDSLWNVAKAALPGSDIRQAVEDIRDLNELDGSVIHPGQVLLIP